MPVVLRVGETGSTMDLAHQLARAGAAPGDAVVAERQLSARGRLRRQWSSEIGGLWLSVVLRPSDQLSFGLLPLRIGLHLAQMIDDLLGARNTQVKWPNDLLIKRRKVAGILCEANWGGRVCHWVIAGVGINLFNPIPEALTGSATRLADHLRDPTGMTLELLEELTLAAVLQAASPVGELTPEELSQWRSRDALWGRALTDPRPGVAVGIDRQGALLLRDAIGQVHPIRSGVAGDSSSGEIPS